MSSNAPNTEEQLLRSEQRFRSLVENSSDILALIDRNAVVQYVSPAIQRITGYTPDEVMGTSGLDLVHADDLPIAKTLLRDLLTRPRELLYRELRVRHSDGQYHTLDVSARNMLDVPGVHGLVVNAHDVTERKLLEDKLRQGQKMEAIGRLAGGIAHDFNNLLTAIRGHAELLLEPGMEGPQRQDVEEIARAADRAASLTRQLLAFSRRQILQPKVLSLEVVVAEMEQLVRRLIGENIELVTRAERDHLTVRADRGQIEQVVMNLAVNARDAMPNGGSLSIEVGPCELDSEFVRRHAGAERGNYVRLRVTDTGSGMDARTMSHIFEPFFTTKEVGKGTGLGLATVYGIVKQSGGYIAVESEPGRGTRFDVFLPAIRVVAEAATPSDPTPPR